MPKVKSLRETYDLIAKGWFESHKKITWWLESTDKFISLLKPGASVLDVGCGAGIKTKYLSEHGLRVTAFDFSSQMVDIAKKEAPGANIFVMDLYDVEKLDQTYDGIFLLAVLLHVPRKEVQGLLKNYAARLRPKGFLYIGVKEVGPDGTEEEMRQESNFGLTYQRFFSYFRSSEITSYLNQLGFNIIYENIRLADKTNWVNVIGQKR